MSVKPFSEHGHYTVVHDAVFDVVMPFCPPNAFKILLFVLRKTRGWKKDEDVLRYEEIKAGTGIRSDATLVKELDWLKNKKLLNARDESGKEHKRGTRRAPAYSLNREFEIRGSTSENEAASTSENEVSNNHPSEEPREPESNDSGAESDDSRTAQDSEGNAIPLNQYHMTRIYDYMKAQGKRLDRAEFTHNLGQMRKVLDSDDPTDEELEALPTLSEEYYDWFGILDVAKALRRGRQQTARREREAQEKSPVTASTPEEKEAARKKRTEEFEQVFGNDGDVDIDMEEQMERLRKFREEGEEDG